MVYANVQHCSYSSSNLFAPKTEQSGRRSYLYYEVIQIIPCWRTLETLAAMA